MTLHSIVLSCIRPADDLFTLSSNIQGILSLKRSLLQGILVRQKLMSNNISRVSEKTGFYPVFFYVKRPFLFSAVKGCELSPRADLKLWADFQGPCPNSPRLAPKRCKVRYVHQIWTHLYRLISGPACYSSVVHIALKTAENIRAHFAHPPLGKASHPSGTVGLQTPPTPVTTRTAGDHGRHAR